VNEVLLSTPLVFGFEITGIKGLDEVLFVIIAGWACVFIAGLIISIFGNWVVDTALSQFSKSLRYAGYKKHGGPTAKEKEKENSWEKLPSIFQLRLIAYAIGLIVLVVIISCRK